MNLGANFQTIQGFCPNTSPVQDVKTLWELCYSMSRLGTMQALDIARQIQVVCYQNYFSEQCHDWLVEHSNSYAIQILHIT